jgi:hypothetical protein
MPLPTCREAAFSRFFKHPHSMLISNSNPSFAKDDENGSLHGTVSRWNFSLLIDGTGAGILVLMKLLLTWILMFGVFAGLNSRVIAVDGTCVACFEDGGSSYKETPQKGDPGDNKCPVDHHHNGCCCHVQLVAAAEKAEAKSGQPVLLLPRDRHESDMAPDGPFLSSEKPPLI